MMALGILIDYAASIASAYAVAWAYGQFWAANIQPGMDTVIRALEMAGR